MKREVRALDFNGLVGRIQRMSAALQQDALMVINRGVTSRAWLTGYYIVEYEQHGKDRAKYGEGLLVRLSHELGSGEFALSTLKNYRAFYLVYPELGRPIAAYLSERFGKSYSASGLLPRTTRPAKSYAVSSLSAKPSLLVEDKNGLHIAPQVLFDRLSYTHIRELVRLDDNLQRTFYAFEAIRGPWSVRELQRQIGSQYYARCGWSKKPALLSKLTQTKAERFSPRDFIKADSVLEFINLRAKDVWDEKDLEQGIVDHLKDFILEMDSGMCFETRQKKILIDDAYEKVDLVFYHRILKCHVLIELKSKKFKYADAAQLSVYMAYYREHMMQADDNPPVGILLCTEVGKEMVKYVDTFIDPKLFVSRYKLQLPSQRKMTDFLRRENAALPSRKGAK